MTEIMTERCRGESTGLGEREGSCVKMKHSCLRCKFYDKCVLSELKKKKKKRVPRFVFLAAAC